jgi:hypothetical protein
MTSINIPRDDAAILVKSTATEREVQPIAPYPKVQPVKVHEDATQAPARQTRKQAERRGKDRRHQDKPVLLDTRSGHDRRNAAAEEKVEIEGEENSSATTGIDIYT